MTTQVTFTITGNHESLTGNPVPFQRMLASQMRYAAGRYVQWQSFVRTQFDRNAEISANIESHTGHDFKTAKLATVNKGTISDTSLGLWEQTITVTDGVAAECARLDTVRRAKKPHPIKIESYRAEMHLKIYWADEKHGDADNVFKGIADSLFENDKELDGSFKSYHSHTPGRGRVEGIIIFTAGMQYDDA